MITPTQFIYEAAKKTPQVITPAGKEITYDFPELPGTDEKYCWLCGGELNGHGIKKKDIIKDTFTDHSYAKCPESDYVCSACVWCLSHRELRNYSIYATSKGLYHPSKEQTAEIILNPPAPPWYLCIAVSGQKWLHFKGKVNLNNTRFTVLLEELPIIIEPESYKKIFEVSEKLYNAGFTKEEIEKLDFPAHKIQKYGILELEEDIKILLPYKGSRMMKLAVYLARKFD